MHYDYKKICEKCKNATDLCGGEDDTKLCYLSDEQALKAINQGMPIGFRSSHPGYHGSDAGLYHFTMADTSDKFYAFKKADSYENSAAYHYVLSDEEIRFLNSKLGKDDSYTIRLGINSFGADAYFGYMGKRQYTDAKDTIYELFEHNPEYANMQVVLQSLKEGFIRKEDYMDAALIVMTAEEKAAHIEAVEMAMDWYDGYGPAVSKADHLLYEQLIQERAEMNRRNQNESLYSMGEEDDEQIINHSTRSR